MLGKIKAASHMHLYQNKIVGWSDTYVTIEEALGKKFDFSELMAVKAKWKPA